MTVHEDERPAIACTLGASGLAAQGERWRRLCDRAAVDRVETAHGLRMRFRRRPGVEEELDALLAIERECCAFADWSLSFGDGLVTLEVTAAGEAVPVVQGMFAGLL